MCTFDFSGRLAFTMQLAGNLRKDIKFKKYVIGGIGSNEAIFKNIDTYN